MLEIINKDFNVNDKVLKHIAKRFNVKSISVNSRYSIDIVHKNDDKSTYFPQCDNMTREEINEYLLVRIKLAIENHWELYNRINNRFSRMNRLRDERRKRYNEQRQ